ncbi:hypothetical protein GGX14DRAFT_402951 [Mycena pura]|uniref:Uncharacterized protein n=1 Tax=Mycena pura TaxID=153505 RepID=A0AAD6Y6Y1_9AGAR|nr:hypothetical protein GGX14DRAFT_402951 [Mycena pura]
MAHNPYETHFFTSRDVCTYASQPIRYPELFVWQNKPTSSPSHIFDCTLLVAASSGLISLINCSSCLILTPNRRKNSWILAVCAGLAWPPLQEPPSPWTPLIADSQDGVPQRDSGCSGFLCVLRSSGAQGVGLSPELSELPPPLSLDVDISGLDVASDVGPAKVDISVPDVVEDDEPWFPVTVKTARSHSTRSESPIGQASACASEIDGRVPEMSTRSTESTITHADQELTAEQLMTIARCHQCLFEQALRAAGQLSSFKLSEKEESIPEIMSEAEVLEKNLARN